MSEPKAVYTIQCKRPSGRWRAGRFFTRGPELYELTESELAAVRADPLFVIADDPRPDLKAAEPELEAEHIPKNARRMKA
jgi:hypothetical protein